MEHHGGEAPPGYIGRIVKKYDNAVRITATQLEQWADTREAQALLPVVIRRLVSATAATQALAIAGGDSVGEPGWDGYTHVAEGNAWVPTGEARWEMGCSEDIIKKARGDFRKRTEQTPPELAEATTFVFVSPRRWRRKAEWQAEAAREGGWYDVRAYDADDLEAWLETAPGVTLWLGELLGLCGAGIESVARYWGSWCHQTRFSLTKEALFAGREAEKEALGRALSKASRVIAVQADSREEAVAFVCAQLLGSGLADSAACITAPEGWRFVDANQSLSIGIAATPEVAQSRALRDNFTMVVPLSSGDKAGYFTGPAASAVEEQHIVLERPRAQQFEDVLRALGEEESDATRLTRATGRSWSVYRRVRARSPAIRCPAWMADPAARSLVIVTLIGGWDGGRQGDRNCLESITRRSYDDFEADLRHIARFDDAPVLQIGSIWKAKAPIDLLYLFGPEITAGELGRFFSVAEVVLAEPDPALELDAGERWMAAVYGKVREESGLVIEAVADALAKLRVYAENSTDPNGELIMTRVDGVVRKLLGDADGQRWLSLAGVLRELAEASPDEFLRAVEASLRHPDAPVRRLLSETGESGAFGRCWHANLLWALEVLAWYPKRLARVTTILAELTTTPIKGNWGNTPLRTLASLFRAWWPQTTATGEERFLIIDRLFRSHNETAWELLFTLVPQNQAWASPNARPAWRDDDAGAPAPGQDRDEGPYIAGIGARLIGQAKGYAERIAQLVDVLDQFGGDYREKVIGLVASAAAFDDDAREAVRARLRHHLHWHSEYGSRNDDNSRREAERLCRYYDALAPHDLVKRHSWLFESPWVELPDGRDDDHGRGRSLREDAIRQVFHARSWGGLSDLAEGSGDPWVVGWTIASAGLPTAALRQWTVEQHRAAGSRGDARLVSGLLHAFPTEVRSELLQDVVVSRSANLDDSALGAFLACAPCEWSTWSVVEQAANDVQECYWRVVWPGYPRGDSEELNYLVAHLLAAGRPRTAFQAVAGKLEQVQPQQVLALLDGLRSGTEPDGPLPRDWHIGKAIEVAERSGQVPRRELALLEFAFYGALGHGEAKPKNLLAEMLSDPVLFMDCVCLVYRRRNAPTEPVDQTLKAAAETAWNVLHDGRGVPGIRDGSVDRTAFEHWVTSVRKIARKQDRAEVTDILIGQWLSKAPTDADGTWPSLVVRDLLDRDDGDRLRNGFSTGVMNNRGVTSRAHDEGGEQERVLAARYRRFTESLHISHPRVAEMLQQLAEFYEREGKRADASARLRIEGH